MRKKTKRQPRPIRAYLTPDEHKRLTTTPHMAMQLLLTNGAQRAQLAILLGFFNLGGALAHFAGDEAFKGHLRHAQDIVARLDANANGQYALIPGPDADHLSAVVHALDDYLKTTRKQELDDALRYVTKAIATRSTESAEVTSIAQIRQESNLPPQPDDPAQD